MHNEYIEQNEINFYKATWFIQGLSLILTLISTRDNMAENNGCSPFLFTLFTSQPATKCTSQTQLTKQIPSFDKKISLLTIKLR